MSDNNEPIKRGPYKRYTKDSSIGIPSSTLRYRRINKAKRTAEEADLDKSETESSESDSKKSKSDDSTDEFHCSTSSENLEKTAELQISSELEVSVFADCENCSEVELSPYDDDECIEDRENEVEDSDSQNNSDGESDISFYNEDPCTDSENDVEEEFDDQGFLPLYDGCELSREESELLIMAFSLRHNLPDIGLNNLLNLVDCHLPHTEYGSKYKFLQSFPYSKYIEYYYCYDCAAILNFENEISTCVHCHKTYRKAALKKREQFFIYVPIKKQLIQLVNSEAFSHFRKVGVDEKDIINSRVYCELQRNNIISEHDLTLTWNTDGVSLFNSSSKSTWPLLISINELPYRIRKNNILLCGIWHDKKKPLMNVFLQPFVDEMIELCQAGFKSTTFLHEDVVKIKVHTVLSSVDSVARPAVQNVKQFNGSYGCSYCLHKGEQISMGKGTARIYTYGKKQGRTQNIHEKILKTVMEKRTIIKGVKGPSVTALLPNFDVITSLPPDYMHACLLGVVKLFATEWFSSGSSSENWYLGTKSVEFNDRLLSINPPCEITRTPQSFLDNKYKASEWKNLLLYYSLPCLNGLMQKKYFKHWFLFVFSMSIYLKSTFTDEESRLAEKAMILFVKDVEKLYGRKFMKYNVHILFHIPRFVKLYGALWAWSAFPFEHFNGVIKLLYHGTQCIPHQICKLYHRLRYVKNHSNVFDKPECNKNARNFFTKLMNQCKVKNCIEYGTDLKIFGKPKSHAVSVTEKVIIESLLGKIIESKSEVYHRFIYQNVLYHSSLYKRLVKRNNSCIITTDNTLLTISCLMKVKCVLSQDLRFVIIGKKFNILDEELCQSENISSRRFCYVVQETNSLVCCEPSTIKRKCINICNNNKSYIFPLVNGLETD